MRRLDWQRLRPVVFGMGITSLMIWAGHLFEPTTLGRWTEFQANRLLHWEIRPAESVPIVVVDISHLPGGKYNATSRRDLLALVRAIAAEKPAAIAVDIDFSPLDGALNKEDKKFFFEECLKISRGAIENGSGASAVPIFLGVGRTWNESPDQWLSDRSFHGGKYQDLAASIVVHPDDTRRMPRWFKPKISGMHKHLRSIGEALAVEYVKVQGTRLPAPTGLFAGLLKTIPSNPDDHIRDRLGGEVEEGEPKVGLSLVNYVEIGRIGEQYTLRNLNAEDVPSEARRVTIRGKMVVIGDSLVEDTFALHSPVLPVRGVLLHACAAYTFAAAPLFEFNDRVRFGLDVALSALLLYLFYRLHALEEKRHHLWRSGVHAFILFLVLVLGWLLVHFESLLWLDFIVIWFALAIHPYAEDGLEALSEKMKSLWKRFRPSPPQPTTSPDTPVVSQRN